MFRHGHSPEMLTRRNHHRCLAGWIYEDQPDTQQPLTSRHLLGRSRRRHSGIARPDEFLELSCLPYFGRTGGDSGGCCSFAFRKPLARCHRKRTYTRLERTRALRHITNPSIVEWLPVRITRSIGLWISGIAASRRGKDALSKILAGDQHIVQHIPNVEKDRLKFMDNGGNKRTIPSFSKRGYDQ